MKKVFALLMVAVLAGSVIFASLSEDLIEANASEHETADAGESTTGEPSIGEQQDMSAPLDEANNQTIGETPPELLETASAPDEIPEPVIKPDDNLPYWQQDATYFELMAEYDEAVAAGHITDARIAITETATSGVSGEIKVGNRKVISSGINAPDYDNAAGMQLTPREGLPQAGMTSDRSILELVESYEDTTLYEATFYFGSDGFPDVPFTAFRTFVVLESEQSPTSDETDRVAADEVEVASEEETKLPFSTYVDRFMSLYFKADLDNNVTDAKFTVSEVKEDGTIMGTVGSRTFAVTGTSGEARALTDSVPAVGQTSKAAMLTFNGSGYDALFLFGDVNTGSESGSAVGGFQVYLDRGAVIPSEALAAAPPNIHPSPALAALSPSISPLAFDPNALYVGQKFATEIGSAGHWNGSMENGWFYANANWNGLYIEFWTKCLDPYQYGPEAINYAGSTLYGTITDIDRKAGFVWMDLYAPGPFAGCQRLTTVNYTAYLKFSGELQLYKESAHPSFTGNHPLYSLAGAQYGLYPTYTDAVNETKRIHLFTTNNSGGSNTAYGLANATYYIKELKAPKGFALDRTIYTVDHTQAVTSFTAKDAPLSDPTLMVAQKLDTETGEAYGKDDPNGLLLADGEFTVRYWDNYYSSVEEAELAGLPTRTWVVRTTSNGRASLVDSLLIGGSDVLYKNAQGDPIIPLGSVSIQETKAPPGYLLPDPNPVSFQQIKETGNPLEPVMRLNTVTVREVPREVVVEKVDTDSQAPVSDTEFTLYKESSTGAGDWAEVTRHITDAHGKCTFSPVAIGSYKLDETRPNELYAELEESGDGAHYFEIVPDSTGEVQVFHNDLIQVSISVYKNTIPLTNTALDGQQQQVGNHVGIEEYLYHFGAKSHSNVRVDEFVVTDSLEYVTSKGYRMTTLWTGTSPEGMDYDGLMHVLYKTNLTSPTEQVSFAYNPMSANPPNANNPQNNMHVSVEPGWRVWQECVSTTAAVRLEVSDLGLREGEYITGLRAVYGGVQKGFYTGSGYGNVRDWSYSVVATGALLPLDEMGNETVMQGTVQADLFRNWGNSQPVLTDVDLDKVETRVIEPFEHGKRSLGITPGGFLGRLGLPVTGDSLWLLGIGLALITGAGITLLVVSKRKQSARKENGLNE